MTAAWKKELEDTTKILGGKQIAGNHSAYAVSGRRHAGRTI